MTIDEAMTELGEVLPHHGDELLLGVMLLAAVCLVSGKEPDEVLETFL